MYGKVLVYFLICELQAAATHTLSAAWWGQRRTLAFLYFTPSTPTRGGEKWKNKKKESKQNASHSEEKQKERQRKNQQLKHLTRKGQSALRGWQSFYGYSPTADLLRWRQWLQSSFSLVAFTTCLLKPPLCYRAVDHNQNSLCEIEFTSGHRGIASWIAGSSPCTACPEINNLQYCTLANTEEPLKAACYLKKGPLICFQKSQKPEYSLIFQATKNYNNSTTLWTSQYCF